jgi:polyisoprenoid-binding protein YceI
MNVHLLIEALVYFILKGSNWCLILSYNLNQKDMKTLLFCLLILSYSGINNPSVSYPKSGGVSVLTINPAISMIGWKAEKLTGMHYGTVKIRSGSLTLHCRQLTSGSILIDMNSIRVTDLQSPRKQQLENNLIGDNFFDTARFPIARLDIVSVNYKSESGNHFITVTGNLMLHGITKRMVFTADVSKSTYTDFITQADIVINRRDFNIATKDFKYDTFIYTDIHLHVLLQANKVNAQISSL